jgi:hypothetical protein
VVEDDEVGGCRGGSAGNFLQLAPSNQGGGIGPVAVLQKFARQFGSRSSASDSSALNRAGRGFSSGLLSLVAVLRAIRACGGTAGSPTPARVRVG